MPELPDVEQQRRLVADRATGARVRRVAVRDRDLLEGTPPQGLGRSLVGRRVGEPRRHGKWLFLDFGADGPTLVVVHFRMTGELAWAEGGQADVDAALTLYFDRGALSYPT